MHPAFSTELPGTGASVTSLVDGVLGDIGNVVRSVLGAQGKLRTRIPLLCGEQGWGAGTRGPARPRPCILPWDQAAPQFGSAVGQAAPIPAAPEGPQPGEG